MNRFCEYCGTPLKDGTKFCTGCGHPVAAKPQPNPQSQQRPEPQLSHQPKTEPTVQPSKPKKKRGFGKVLLWLVIIVAAIVGISKYVDNRKWKKIREEITKDYPELQKELDKKKQNQNKNQDPSDTGSADFASLRIIKNEEGSISEANPAVTLCGVTIDATPEMLKDGSKPVSVSMLESSVSREGLRSENYELSMEPHERFKAPVEVTFPCHNAKDTDPVVAHYDAETDEWIPLMSFVDHEKGTASAYFGSFSPAKLMYLPVGMNPQLYVVDTPDPDEPYVKKIKVSPNYWSILQRINPEVYEGEVKKFSQNPEKYAVEMPNVDPNGGTKAAYEAFQKSSDIWTVCDPMINLGVESLPPASQKRVVQYMIDNSGKLGSFMNSVPFVMMGAQVTFDMYKASKSSGSGKEGLQTTAINLYKNLLGNSGSIYSLAAKYSHIGFSLSFFGVALIGKEIDYCVDQTKAAKVDNVQEVFNTYYTKTAPFDAYHWYEVFEAAYWKNEGNIKGAMNDLKAAVDNYCHQFWNDVYGSNNDELWLAMGDSKYKKIFNDATEEQKQALTEQQKHKVWELIETKSIKYINQFMIERMQNKVLKQLNKNPMIDEYNKDLTIEIKEIPGDEDTKAKYLGYTICLGTDGKPFKGWHRNIPDDDELKHGWTTEFLPCTVYGYLQMGMPNQVLIYKTEKDFKNGEIPEATKKFEPDLKGGHTEINLHGAAADEEPEEPLDDMYVLEQSASSSALLLFLINVYSLSMEAKTIRFEYNEKLTKGSVRFFKEDGEVVEFLIQENGNLLHVKSGTVLPKQKDEFWSEKYFKGTIIPKSTKLSENGK